MTLPELFQTFPDEKSAEQWLAAIRWQGQLWCPACGSDRWYRHRTRDPRQVAMRYRCKDCKGYYSVRKGTLLGQNKTKLRTWVLAIHLLSSDMPLRTSMLTLHEGLGISRVTAWRMAKTIREALAAPGDSPQA